MTQEEKARAYDEALERAKIEINTKGIGEAVNLCYQLFPQLAENDDEESDDERIRKRLIEYFEGFRMGNAEVRWEGLIVQEVLAWLKKQKECVADNSKTSTDEDERIINQLITLVNSAGEVLLIPTNKEELVAWLNKYKESLHIPETCKENAYSFTEDERIRTEMISMIKACTNWVHKKEYIAWLEKQKKNPKSSDSIPVDCTPGAKCEDRWHKVGDSLPDNPREVLCKDEAGNYFIGRYYVGEGWDISNYDDEDKPHHLNPPVSKWIDFPSEKQKEQNEEPKIAFGDWGDKEKKEAIITCLKYMRFIKKITNEECKDLVRWFEDNLVANVLEKDGWTIASEQTDTIKEDYYGAFLRGEMRGYLRAKNEQKPNDCLYGGNPSVGRCQWCYADCSARLTDVHTDEEKEYVRTIKSIISDFIRDKKPENLAYYQRIYDWLDGRHVPFSCGHENGKSADPVFSKQEYESHPIISKDTTSTKPVEFDGKALLHTADKSYQIGFRDGVASVKPAEWNKATINGKPIPTENHSVDIPLAEWSEEDERKRNGLIKGLQNRMGFASPNVPFTREEYIAWLESLPERFNLQPKQEWREEDEKMIDDICFQLDGYPEADVCEMKSWLKSLRPSWKPSEEQMESLRRAVDKLAKIDVVASVSLSIMYDNLKKLM